MRLLRLISLAIAALLAAPAASAQLLAQAAPGAARAGVAAAVKGDVKLAAVPGVRPVGKDVASGDPIFLGDQVTTGAEGRLQIMLLDETVFTIGPNAALVIDKFVFDPQTSAGKVTASVIKGTFRFVTGKVAKREPSDMEVKLPVGSIGVRGTSVAGHVDGDRATVVLLGPGPETNTNERVGRILVTGTGAAGAATTVEIVRPGFGTEIAGRNIPPTPAVRIDPGRIAAITAPLAGTARPTAPSAPGQGQQGQAQPGQPQSGQPAPGQPQPGPQPGAPGPAPIQVATAPPASAGGAITFVSAPINPGGGLTGIKTIGALVPTGQQVVKVTTTAGQTPAPLGIDTTFEQLRSIGSGTATFASQSVSLAGGPGTASYTINYSYNFASRTATGSVAITAGAGWGTTGTDSVTLIASPFTSGSGQVKLGETISVPSGPGGTVRIDYGFKNNNNTVFKALVHSVQYNQGGTYNAGTNSFTGGDTASGNGVTVRP